MSAEVFILIGLKTAMFIGGYLFVALLVGFLQFLIAEITGHARSVRASRKNDKEIWLRRDCVKLIYKLKIAKSEAPHYFTRRGRPPMKR